ncbi:CCAAT/enhancer binding protein (C/EBP) 1 [Aplochiton taeniatus]
MSDPKQCPDVSAQFSSFSHMPAPSMALNQTTHMERMQCSQSSGAQSSVPHHLSLQEFSTFLLPFPPEPLQNSMRRNLSKDSTEYRLRRERNNIAVRKSRDKARRRIQLTQQRALQLQEENHRLQMVIGKLTHELDTLKNVLSQRHIQTTADSMAREKRF